MVLILMQNKKLEYAKGIKGLKVDSINYKTTLELKT